MLPVPQVSDSAVWPQRRGSAELWSYLYPIVCQIRYQLVLFVDAYCVQSGGVLPFESRTVDLTQQLFPRRSVTPVQGTLRI